MLLPRSDDPCGCRGWTSVEVPLYSQAATTTARVVATRWRTESTSSAVYHVVVFAIHVAVLSRKVGRESFVHVISLSFVLLLYSIQRNVVSIDLPAIIFS